MLRALAINTKNTNYLFDADGRVIRQPRVEGSPNYTGMHDGEPYEVIRRPDCPSSRNADSDTSYGPIKFAVRDHDGDVLHITTSSVVDYHYLSALTNWHEEDTTFYSRWEVESAMRTQILQHIVTHPLACVLSVNYKGRVVVSDFYSLDDMLAKASPGLFHEDREKIVDSVVNDAAIIKVEIDPYSL